MKSRVEALAGYKGMMAGKGLVIPGVLNKTIAMSVRFSPRKNGYCNFQELAGKIKIATPRRGWASNRTCCKNIFRR
jgi:hypothetical protein